MTTIDFSPDELSRFAQMGAARCASALSRRRQGAHGFDRDHERWQIDCEGVLAEAAVSKALGFEYEATLHALDTAKGDLGDKVNSKVQVRSTKYQTGSLLIHGKDADDHRFVLVTGIYGSYTIRGWILGEFGKHDNLWKTYKGRGAYWVPQDMLRVWDRQEMLDWMAK